MKRAIYRVQWSAERRLWTTRISGVLTNYSDTKTDAVFWIKLICKRAFELFGERSQLVIHNKNGRIQSERTYPDTTPKRKG